jgi:hypothetical protein
MVEAMSSEAPMAVALFVSAASMAWSAAYAWTRWLVRPEARFTQADELDRIDSRLAHIENAVDAIAVEVERLGEAQRYAARLIDDRLPHQVQPHSVTREHSRVDTPH